MRERVILIGLLFVVLLLVGCGGPSAESGPTDKCELDNPPLFEKGQLTVATDKPAYPPWFKGSPKDYSGYEGDVASEIAERMDLPIKWIVEPFNKSYAPGAKDFDFDINEITITQKRETAVDFSDGYFDNAQGVLVMKDIAGCRREESLRPQGLDYRGPGRHYGARFRQRDGKANRRTPRSTTPPTTRSPRWRAARSTSSSPTW